MVKMNIPPRYMTTDFYIGILIFHQLIADIFRTKYILFVLVYGYSYLPCNTHIHTYFNMLPKSRHLKGFHYRLHAICKNYLCNILTVYAFPIVEKVSGAHSMLSVYYGHVCVFGFSHSRQVCIG
jgi:hypothetical protein